MDEVQWACPSCRRSVRVRLFPVHCACGFVQYCHPPGLGDRVARLLARLGVTRRRYVALKRAVGLCGDCRCPERQRALNAWGRGGQADERS